MTAYPAPGRGKNKTTDASGGYGQEPEPAASPDAYQKRNRETPVLDARGSDDDTEVCGLEVVVYAGDDPAQAARHPVAKADVSITSGSFHQTRRTDEHGRALWREIEPGEYEVEVLALSEIRGPASVAQTLYRETEASKEARKKAAEERKAMQQHMPLPERRPSKRDRRRIVQFRGGR